MPISCTFTIITALSMAGVPPFNGFLSKELASWAFLGKASGLYSPKKISWTYLNE